MTAHECNFQTAWDQESVRPQYVVRCRCHEFTWHIKIPTDAPYVCPESGDVGPIPLLSEWSYGSMPVPDSGA